jgi:biotin operon repressor
MYMMELPKDPMMLFSVINMKLRDCYSSLDELCEEMSVSKEDIVNQLKTVGFEYSAEHNKFW